MIYCCEMAFVTASFIHFTLTKDWFKIWSWLNYSWILYYPLGSLLSVLLIVSWGLLYILQVYITMWWHSCNDHTFPVTTTISYTVHLSTVCHSLLPPLAICELLSVSSTCITCKNKQIHYQIGLNTDCWSDNWPTEWMVSNEVLKHNR